MALATPNPTADIKLVFSQLPDGRLGVDYALTPSGDLAFVTGINRLVQEVTRWLLTPRGNNPFDPTYGNALFSLMGRPANQDTSAFIAMVDQTQADLVSRQSTEAASGFLALDEQIDHFENVTAQLQTGQGGGLQLGSVLLGFTVISKGGASKTLIVPFTLTVAA